MLKLSKKVDYGLMALMHLSQHQERASWSAREIAESYDIPMELMAKILQKMAQNGFVISHHGTHGGYSLGRPADRINVAEVIEVIEGPLALTDCFSDHSACLQFEKCNLRSPLQVVNDSVLGLLSRLTIAQMNQHTTLSALALQTAADGSSKHPKEVESFVVLQN